MRKHTVTSKSGFSLIELLVVMTIIAILAVAGIVNFTSASKSARDSRRVGDLETVRQAFVLYRSQNGTYLDAGASFGSFTNLTTDLITQGYLSNPAPKDPSSSKSYVLVTNTATAFCLCATVDNTTNGNTAAQNCSSLTAASGAYYCVQQP